jgi:dephospho-CoA kinase
MGIAIGITGGIGSGKSIVAKAIKVLGYPVFYSDEVAKDILANDAETITAMKALLGDGVYSNGKVNRDFIADKIFNDQTLKEKVNQIIHPKVRNRFNDLLNNSENDIVFNEAAILFETGAYKNFDFTICVVSDLETRIERVKKRDGISEEAIRARINNQWSDEKKLALADFVIYNNNNDLLIPQILTTLGDISNSLINS